MLGRRGGGACFWGFVWLVFCEDVNIRGEMDFLLLNRLVFGGKGEVLMIGMERLEKEKALIQGIKSH